MGVLSAVGATLENGLVAYVNSTAAQMALALVPVATAGICIWAVLYGIAVVRGEVHEPIWGYTWRLTKMALILSVALGQGVYQTHIISAIQGAADGLVTTMAGGSNAACMLGGKGQQVYATLDCTWTQFMEVGLAYYKDGARVGFWSAPDVAFARLVSAILVWLAGSLFTIVMAAEVLVARYMLGLALVFGPLCIATLAFEPAKKYFDGWMGFVWFCVVMQAVCVAFLGLSMTAIAAVMNPLQVPSGAADATTWAGFEKAIAESGNAWGAVLAIVTLFALLFYIGAFRLSGLASALSGGGSHSSVTGAAMAFVAGRVLGGGSGSSGGGGGQGGEIKNAGGAAGSGGGSTGGGGQQGGTVGPTASQRAAGEGRAMVDATSAYESASGDGASESASGSRSGSSSSTYSGQYRPSYRRGESVGRSVGRAAEMMRKRMKS